jgi:hypothetical protein
MLSQACGREPKRANANCCASGRLGFGYGTGLNRNGTCDGFRGFCIHAGSETRRLSFSGPGRLAEFCMIHNTHYDYDDLLLPIGSSVWVALVERELPPG